MFDFLRRLFRDPAPAPIAATSPDEFFAVCSEVFFTRPDLLQEQFPAFERLLRRYYRPDLSGSTRPSS